MSKRGDKHILIMWEITAVPCLQKAPQGRRMLADEALGGEGSRAQSAFL